MNGAIAKKMDLKGRKALVVGLGLTGLATVKFLVRMGAVVTATDLKSEDEIKDAQELRAMGVRLECGGHEPAVLSDADLVVISPGVPSELPLLKAALERGAEVMGEVELASRFIDAPIAAVTGTNGKTTTTTLIGEALKMSGKSVFVGGNIGTPAIEYMSGDRKDACVLEISSFHLETTRTFRPRAAVLLNITEDHLYRYDGFSKYGDVKFNIFMNQGAGDAAVVNVDDPEIKKRVGSYRFGGKFMPMSPRGRNAIEGDGVFLREGRMVLRLDGIEEEYPLETGAATSMENLMAVVATARFMGGSSEAVAETLRTFKGLPHRIELVRAAGGVSYVNDSKATNVGSVVEALRTLRGPIVLILGGVDKGGDYGVLRDLIREKVRLMVITGAAREKISAAIGGAVETMVKEKFNDAVRAAIAAAKSGDTVLLSPACSSFDEFSGFEERGARFRAIVEGTC
jgi:UDP-N-acetylmuramoylalanine--D-glutamate ligase